MKFIPSSGFSYYIALIGDADFKTLFISSETIDWLSGISEEESALRYAPGKWSVKQIVGHLADHERIMMYRALRFSRKDPTQLAGYDQNLLVENARFEELSYQHILEDFKNVRKSSVSMIEMFSDEQLSFKGFAWKLEISVIDLLKATLGHELHHINVIRKKYFRQDL
jgi:hypothetical protein